MVRFFIICMFLLGQRSGHAGEITHRNWKLCFSESGGIERIVFYREGENDTIPFFRGKKQGPAFYVCMPGEEKVAEWMQETPYSFRARIGDVEGVLTYREYNDWPSVEVTLTNKGRVPFQPEKAGLKLGIDTYMDKYPDWFRKYFPTFLRCEKTHFYGYLQTPEEHILAVVCQQPIASWSVDYNLGYMDPAPYWFMGHRIESLNLDFLNALPLPDRHPQHLYRLKKGESRTWIVSFVRIGQLEQLESGLYKASGLPMVEAEKTAWLPGEEAVCDIWAARPEVEVTDEQGTIVASKILPLTEGHYRLKCVLPAVGLYRMVVRDGDKQAEAVWTVTPTWRWTMEKARENAWKYHQKASSHIESWYGFYSAFIAARYFPSAQWDEILAARFEYLFRLLHDTVKMEPAYYASRIQNTAGTIGLLVDKYEAGGKRKDLERASRLGDWLMRTSQREDGAYYNHGIKYTSVIYVAKSMLELALAEREAARTDTCWQKPAERHYHSARRAVDELVKSQGNFETEGEMTFEDGMISCSALQIGMFALLQDDPALREHYREAMLTILNSHSCLTQLKVPDGRRRQGTMRYWEAQYDVQMLPNMFNSPHGWSAWRAYATYYAYLLTGEEKWLLQTFNAMGAFANLIDYRTGDLRWAFVVDPHVKVEQACSADPRYTFDSLSFGNPHPKLYDTRRFVIGEQYVNMVSDWQTVNTQDNDVHEVFKCMGECVLTNAFLVERTDGSIGAYNCRVKRKGRRLMVSVNEKQISHLHCNLRRAAEVVFEGRRWQVPANELKWIKF